jgi:hypothetical protein
MLPWSPIEDVVLVRCRLRGDDFADIVARAFPGRSASEAAERFDQLRMDAEHVLEQMSTPQRRATGTTAIAKSAAVDPDDEDDDAPASIGRDSLEADGCRRLLHGLIRYGFRHDGLPGLTAEAFHALAKREGITKGGVSWRA